MMIISHDLSVLADISDRIAVMYAGRVVEQGPADLLFTDPLHPYTARSRRRSRGSATRPPATRRPGLKGDPPDPRELPPGCSFAPALPAGDRRSAGRPSPRSRHKAPRPRRRLHPGGVRTMTAVSAEHRPAEPRGAAASAVEFTSRQRRRRGGARRGRPDRALGRDRGARGRVRIGQDHPGADPDRPGAARRGARSRRRRAAGLPREVAEGVPAPGADDPAGPGRRAEPAAHGLRVGRRGAAAAQDGRLPTRRGAARSSRWPTRCRRPACGRRSGCSCATRTSCRAASGSGC